MISAQELRIGNLVYSSKSNYSHPAGIQKILSIGESYANKWQDMGASGGLSYSDLSGIPLSEEWLRKCGFKKQSDHLDGHFFRPDDIVLQRNLTTGGWNYFYTGCFLRNIEYVHQLQNLFWCLVGEELKIEV